MGFASVRSAAVVLLALWSASAQSAVAGDEHAVILLYHHISTATPASTSIDPATFAAQLDYLADHHFHVWSLTRILAHIRAGKPVPDDTVALTFDDAYASVFTEAYPRLKRRGWPFTVFVSTDYIDGRYRGYMTWGQLREVAKNGAQLGNHSRSHPHLVRRRKGESVAGWRARVRAQIEGAQRRLEAETPAPVKVFAYPYGEYSRSLEEIVTRLGFLGVGQQSGAVGSVSDLRAAPRFPMAGAYAGLKQFATKVRTRPLPVTVLAPADPFLGRAPVTPVLRLRIGEGPFRLGALACYASGQGRMDLTWPDRAGRVVQVRPRRAFSAGGRFKYNCTAPARAGNGVYYWYSHLWMKRNPDGSWYKE